MNEQVTKKRAKSRSQLGLIALRFKKNKFAVFGLIILCIIAVIILTAPLYISYDAAIRQNISIKFQAPSAEHPFGTDLFGRDMLARIIYGGRISLFTGLAVILCSLMMGIVLGGISGYFGGKIDQLIMRIIDIFMAIPQILLVLAIVATLGTGLVNLIAALIISMVPRFSRIVRSSILTLKSQEFVEAAQCYGTSTFRIITKHLLPNGIGPVIVAATITLGAVIISISSLGFLGVGVEPPTPEWGSLLADNRSFIRYYPHLGILPGIAIVITVMCVNFVGDGLRDALDPKMRK